MAYAIESPGRIDGGRVLTRMVRTRMPLYIGGDGMAVDVRGNLYIASRRGVQIFDPSGRLLGILDVPEIPANVAFGGADRKTLYITARHSIYAVPLAVAGP
jgi:gluconolactonase